MTRIVALFSASTILAVGLAASTGPSTSVALAPTEHVAFDEPAYLIVHRADDAPMATGALEVEEVQFEQALEVRLYRTPPGV